MRKAFGAIVLVCVLGLLLGGPPVAAQTTLAFGNPGEPVELDPAVLVDTISSRITTQILEGLVKYKGATTEVVPALAE
jgi:ABC-type transport system substrate-binding protein